MAETKKTEEATYMAIEVFNRYEQKYMLDYDTYKKVVSVMDKHMTPDIYNVNHEPKGLFVNSCGEKSYKEFFARWQLNPPPYFYSGNSNFGKL